MIYMCVCMILDASLLITQYYKVHIKGKWSNPMKGVAPLSTPQRSSYWKGSLRVPLDYNRPTYLTYILYTYIYIYTHTRIHMYLDIIYIYIYTHTRIHMYLDIIYIYIYIYTCIIKISILSKRLLNQQNYYYTLKGRANIIWYIYINLYIIIILIFDI